MPKMPRTEAGRIALAQQIQNGLNTNPNLAASPVDKTAFAAIFNAFTAKRDEILVKEAQLSLDYDAKEDLEEDLVEAMQRIIDYLSVFTNNNATELASIGWGTASAPVKQPPGQPRVLEIIRQLEADLGLDWKNPLDGGRVASYRVERRERPSGPWETCGATNLSEILLTNQPRGKDLEYRVIAFNSNGDSVPSNSVSATL